MILMNLFLGRFHPLLVHLPIGFLLLAVILFFTARKKNNAVLHVSVPFCFLLGAISSLLSVILGLLLANSGGYDDDALGWHKWLGILLTVVSFTGWYFVRFQTGKKTLLKWVNISIVILLFATGHFGGSLTHGPDYLVQNAPAFIKNIFVKNDSTGAVKLAQNIPADSVKVYDALVYNILETKCISCHNPDKKNGGLVITDKMLFSKGGDTGPALAPGAAHKSLLFERITLPKTNEKRMPPKGEALSYSQIQLIEWWINNGASFDKQLKDFELNNTIGHTLKTVYGLSTEKRPYLETVKVPPAGEGILKQLTDAGFVIKPIMQESNVLDVKYKSVQPLTAEKIKLLESIALQTGWLDISNTVITDEQLASFAHFKNLVRLNISGTGITEKGLQFIPTLKFVESLNVNNTKVTNELLQQIVLATPSLKHVYVWQTGITAEAVAAITGQQKSVEVVRGFDGAQNIKN